MAEPDVTDDRSLPPRCCPCGHEEDATAAELDRRTFLGVGGAALGGAVLGGLSWSSLAAAEPGVREPPGRRPLAVKPIFSYPVPQRQAQTSWRNWGGMQTRQDVDAEIARIRGELEQLKASADFPLEFLPLAVIRRPDDLGPHKDDLAKADALLFYAGGDGGGDLMANVNHIDRLGKNLIFFVRHQSGPLYYWYEGAMARFLHQHTDALAARSVDYQDVVVDRMDEVLWRLRALCGLANTVGSRIVAIGGPGGWHCPAAPKLAQDRWKLDLRTVSYDDVGGLLRDAMADGAALDRARRRAEQYLNVPGTTLETGRPFVDNAFLLEEVFRALMGKAECRAMTIRGCMRTIMPISQTTACLPLSTLNDAGWLAFCESDFVVIPAGLLLANISGRPAFLQNPTFPHEGAITLAHCTAPRKMDGRRFEPARIMTHYESDYGAAPKVEMRKGQELTMIAPDFKAERWLGLSGKIVDHPLMPICRSQLEVALAADGPTVAGRMPGFHWMLVYGNYLREVGYALKKVPIRWDCLG